MNAKAFIQSFGAILLWSALAYLAVQLSQTPPFLLVGSALIIGSTCGLRKISQWRVSPSTLLLGVYGIFGFHFCLFLALRHAPPVEGNLINYLWPLLIVILSPIFLSGYSLHARHVFAALLGFAGAVLIVTGGKVDFQTQYAMGYFLAGISAFIWSTYSLMTKRVKPFPNAAIGLFCLVSGVFALAMHVLLEPSYRFEAGDLPLLLILGLGPMGAAFFLWDAALKNGDPRVIGSLAYLTPMLSTLILVSSGKGTLSPVSAAAMALIVGGAVLGSFRASSGITSN